MTVQGEIKMTEYKKIRIEGGPTGHDTKVYIDGEEQTYLTNVKVDLEAGEVNIIHLTYHCIDVEVEIEGNIEEIKKDIDLNELMHIVDKLAKYDDVSDAKLWELTNQRDVLIKKINKRLSKE